MVTGEAKERRQGKRGKKSEMGEENLGEGNEERRRVRVRGEQVRKRERSQMGGERRKSGGWSKEGSWRGGERGEKNERTRGGREAEGRL